MNKAEALTALAQRTGLSRNTIKDLMKSGWTYEEKPNEPKRFVGPEVKVKR